METIGINVSFGKEKVTFHQKIINSAEETRLRERFFGLSETEKEEKGFQINVGILEDYAGSVMEVRSFDEAGKEVYSPSKIKNYFSENTPIKERIADYAVRAYLIALQPKVDFL